MKLSHQRMVMEMLDELSNLDHLIVVDAINAGTSYIPDVEQDELAACVKAGRPWIYGGCVGSYGMVMTVLPGESSCLRCAEPEGFEVPAAEKPAAKSTTTKAK